MKKPLLAGATRIAAVAIAAGSAGGWFARGMYDQQYVEQEESSIQQTILPKSSEPAGQDTRTAEDLPACAELDPST
jgi:hypothetical protein